MLRIVLLTIFSVFILSSSLFSSSFASASVQAPAIAASTPMKAEGVGTVTSPFVCKNDATLALAEAAVKSADEANASLMASLDSGACRMVGGIASFPVTRVLDGPFTDFEGDRFYIVEVAPGLSVLAWEGLNYQPAGFEV